MTPNISAMEAEIAAQQAIIQAMRDRKNDASAIYANALGQRPAGVPANWLPDLTISAGTSHVWAWFDPARFGERLNRT